MEQLVVGQRRFSTRHVKELSPCLTAQAVVRSAISLSTQRLALVGAKRSMWTLGQPPTEVDPAGTLLKKNDVLGAGAFRQPRGVGLRVREQGPGGL